MKISAALATYNEEENIARCLESIASWVDEIVIVDGSSTDKTVKIAKNYQSKVTVTNNLSNFHINKQKAIDACKGDWILQLDADEAVSPELKNEILSVINDRQQTINYEPTSGYWIPRKNYFLGVFLKKGGQYPDYTLRLYKRGKGRLPQKSVHEQAVVEGKTAYLRNPLLHYSYPNFSHYLSHFNLYTDILAQELEEKNLPLSLRSFLKYMIIYPKWWFLKTYFRHKGFEDGFAGFTFSLFSSLRFPTAYIKYWEKNIKNK